MNDSEINFIKKNYNRQAEIKKKYFIEYKKNQIKNWYQDNNKEIDYVFDKILLLLNNNNIILNTDLDNFYNKLIVYTNNNSI